MRARQPAAEEAEPVDFDAFIRARGPELVAQFAWVSAHGLDPEDVVQDTLLLVHARFASRTFTTSTLLYGYCYVIGRNLVRSLLGPDAYTRNEVVSDDPARDALRTVAHDPEGIAVRNADLALAYATLPENYRQVLVLAGDGFDHDMIAAAMRLPSAEAARRLLFRARTLARRRLGGPCVVIPAAWRFRHRFSPVTQTIADNAAAASGPVFHGAVTVAAACAVTLVVNLGGSAPAAPRDPARPTIRATAPSLSPSATGRGAPGGPGSESPKRTGAVQGVASATFVNPARHHQSVALAAPPKIKAPCPETVCPPTPTRRGWTLRIRRLGSASPEVTQDTASPCHVIPTNREVTCTEQEP